MAQISISHSARNDNLVNSFSKAGAGTKVKPVFDGFEKIVSGRITSLQIGDDIKQSQAVSVILSSHVEALLKQGLSVRR